MISGEGARYKKGGIYFVEKNTPDINMTTYPSREPLIKAIVLDTEAIPQSYTPSELSIKIGGHQAEIVPVEMGIGPEERTKQVARQLKALGEDGEVPKEPEQLSDDKQDEYESLKKEFIYLRKLYHGPGETDSPSYPPYELVPAILIQCNEKLREVVQDEDSILETDFNLEGFLDQTYDNPLEPMVDGTDIPMEELISDLQQLLSEHQIEQIQIGGFWNIGEDAGYFRLHPERTVEIDSITRSELQANLRVLTQ